MQKRNGRVHGFLERDEEIEERVELGDREVVVTSDRVFTVSIEEGGESYRVVDRSSVDDVTVAAEGERKYLLLAGKAALIGAIPLAIDVALDFDQLLVADSSEVPPSAAHLVEWIELIFAAIDLSLTLLWLVLSVIAAGYLTKYVVGRSKVLEMAVVDDSDITVPVDDEAPVERLDSAISADEPADPLAGEPAEDRSSPDSKSRSDDPFSSDAAADASGESFASGSSDAAADASGESFASGSSDDSSAADLSEADLDDLFDSDSTAGEADDLFDSAAGEADDPFEES